MTTPVTNAMNDYPAIVAAAAEYRQTGRVRSINAWRHDVRQAMNLLTNSEHAVRRLKAILVALDEAEGLAARMARVSAAALGRESNK